MAKKKTSTPVIALISVALAALGGVLVWQFTRPDRRAPSPGPEIADTHAAAPDGPKVEEGSTLGYRYRESTPAVEITAKIDPAAHADPTVSTVLRARADEAIDNFKTAMVEPLSVEGDGATRPMTLEVDWVTKFESPYLLSAMANIYEDTGGAHPNAAYDSVLFDRTATPAQVINLIDLFADPLTVEDIRADLCARLLAAKIARTGDDLTFGEPTECPAPEAHAFVLVAGGAAGKAGALQFLFSPYEFGAWAEGTYEITVPASVFAKGLAPRFQEAFGL